MLRRIETEVLPSLQQRNKEQKLTATQKPGRHRVIRKDSSKSDLASSRGFDLSPIKKPIEQEEETKVLELGIPPLLAAKSLQVGGEIDY